MSVIIPVYNDRDGVATTLESLSKQDLAGIEVLVVDNNSTDNTSLFLRSYAEDHEWLKYLVEAEVQSSYAARNTGLEHATGELIAFIDADMTVPERWAHDTRQEFTDREIDYLGCAVELVIEGDETVFDRYDQFTGFPIKTYIETQQFCPTCCLVVRRSVIDDVGRFDSRLVSGGDKEFGNRVADAGYELVFADDIVLQHPTRSSFTALAKKDIRVGKGLGQLQQLYPDRYGRNTPKPSGAKSPRKQIGDVGLVDYAIFSLFGLMTVGIRGIGYLKGRSTNEGTIQK
ncbi:glycosyltransferase family 2 protein [Halorubraceae archaeon YAN]|nr:glycosyltransferase family 2 protein [Halorubraceae archaeon YAN]